MVNGRCVEAGKNSAKFYIAIMAQLSDGREATHVIYGRMGVRGTQLTYDGSAKFAEQLRAKFGHIPEGFVEAVKVNDTRFGPYATGSTKYTISYEQPMRMDAVDPSAAVAATAPAPQPEKSMLDPSVKNLIMRIGDPNIIRQSINSAVNSTMETAGTITIPTPQDYVRALDYHKRAMANIPVYLVSRDASELYACFNGILLIINATIPYGKGAAQAMATSIEFWNKLGNILDRIGIAINAIHNINQSNGASASSSPSQGAATSISDDSLGSKLTADMFPGVYCIDTFNKGPAHSKRTVDTYAGSGIIYTDITYEDRAKQAFGPAALKRYISSLRPRDVPIAAYAAINCDVVPGSYDDVSIVVNIMKNMRRRPKNMNLFTVYPYTSHNKYSKFRDADTVLLVHGTQVSSVREVLNGELDLKYCSGGRLGAKCVYLADDVRKSEEYAQVDGGKNYFFLVEAIVPGGSGSGSGSGSGLKLKTVVNDMNWHSTDGADVVIHADSPNSHRAFDMNSTVIAPPYAGGFDYYGDGSRMRIPNQDLLNPSTPTSDFRYAEYTYRDNSAMRIRYIVECEYSQ